MSSEQSGAPSSELSGKQKKALAALLSAPTLEMAATAAGISVVTLWRYLKDETFATAYRDARREVVSHAIAQLQGAASEAVETLREVASDGEATPGARVSAAKTILDLSLKAVELEDVVARVEALEQQQAAIQSLNGSR